MNNLRHNLYGTFICAFAAVCVVGLLALGLVALNAYSDYRHERYIYDLEHPTPTPTPSRALDPSSAGDVLYAGVEAMNGFMPCVTIWIGIGLGLLIIKSAAQIVGKSG